MSMSSVSLAGAVRLYLERNVLTVHDPASRRCISTLEGGRDPMADGLEPAPSRDIPALVHPASPFPGDTGELEPVVSLELERIRDTGRLLPKPGDNV